MRHYLEAALVDLYKLSDSQEKEVRGWAWEPYCARNIADKRSHLTKFLEKTFPRGAGAPLGGSNTNWDIFTINREGVARAIAAVEAAVASEARSELAQIHADPVWSAEKSNVDNGAFAQQLVSADWIDQGDGTSKLLVTDGLRAIAAKLTTGSERA